VPSLRWDRLPYVCALSHARDWLEHEMASGLSASTIDAYSRAVESYLAYCRQWRVNPHTATSEHIAAYLRELTSNGLGTPTLLQRLAAIRLFYTYIVEQTGRSANPVTDSAIPLIDPMVDTDRQLPWIPTDDEWRTILGIARTEASRTHLMLALSYEAALHREQIIGLTVASLDLSHRALRIREANGETRVVSLSATIIERCAAFLEVRLRVTRGEERLFLSESPRNRAAPISIWTWSKVVREIAQQSGIDQFTTHTPRHLRLFDLAQDGWSAKEIAGFAGLSVSLAHLYLRLTVERPRRMDTGVAKRREHELDHLLFAAVA
jgi:integrase/recombinase XerD